MADSVKIKIDGDDSGFQKSLSNVNSSIKKGVGIAVKSIASIGVAFGKITISALDFSSKLEQNLGGSEAVFKEYAGSIQASADDAFKNMGLSASDFLANANKMGALFQGAGFSIEESADLSSQAMQRAADVASIMGIDVSMAMESIAGAAKGNFTMMDNLGVAMNATTIEAYALSKGIDKSYSSMSNQEKVAIAMEMFLEKTAYAAGNYAKENETLAGSLTTAQAALKNFISGAGDVDDVVDALSNAAKVILKNLGNLLPKLVDGIEGIVKELIPMIPDILRELIPCIMSVVTELINTLIATAPQIVSALAEGIGAALPILQPITNAIKALMDNFNMLVPVLTAVGVVIGTFKAVSVAATAATIAQTTAQAALNAVMLLNPATALIAGIAGLTAGMYALAKSSKAAGADNEILNSVNTELIETNERLKTSFDEVNTACQANAAEKLNEVAFTENLVSELDKLVGANYEVKESDQARVDFIMGELKNALGEEYNDLQDIIDQNGNVTQSVYDAIEAQKAQILLESNKEAYAEALNKQAEASKAVGTAYLDLQNKTAELQKAMDSVNFTGSIDDFLEWEDAVTYGYGEVVENFKTAQTAYDDALQNQANYTSTVINYENAIAAAREGNTQKAMELLTQQDEYTVKSTDTATEAQQKKASAFANALAAYQSALDEYGGKTDEFSKSQIQDAKEHAIQMGNEAKQAGVGIANGYMEGMDGVQIDLQGPLLDAFNMVNFAMEDKWEYLGERGATAVSNTSPSFESAGGDTVAGVVKGIEDNSYKAYNAGYNLAKDTEQGYKDGQNSNSPAKDYVKLSKDSIAGLIKGIEDNKGEMYSTMYALAEGGCSEYEKALKKLYKDISQADYKRQLEFANSVEDILKIKSTEVEGLLDYEKEYLAEKARIQHERDEADYQERLQNAKDAESREKIKQERINEIAKKEQDAYLEQLEEAADNERKIYDALVKDIENMVSDAIDSMEEIAGARDNLSNRFKGDLELTNTITFINGGGDGKDLTYTTLADISAQTEDMQAYADALEAVKERGELPEGFFKELRGMSTEEGLKVAQALLNASDEEFNEYLKDWEAYQSAADSISTSLYSDEFGELKSELENQFGQLPEDFFVIGEDSAKQYGEGFMRQLEVEFKKARDTIASEWNSMSSGFVISVAGAGGGTTINNNTNVTVNSNGGGSQTDEIRAWNDAMTVEQMRN